MDKPSALVFPPTAAEYEATIRRYKAKTLLIARKLERGISLDESETIFAALQLKERARSMVEDMPKKRGRPPLVNYSDVARDYVLLVQRGTGKAKAKEFLAEQYGVSEVDTIDDALRAKLKAAEAIYGPAQGK